MRFGVIPPLAHLHDFATNDFHLILAHLLDDDRYLSFYRERQELGDLVVLDNSAYEFGSSIDLDLLYESALAVKASEIVLPDVLRDRDATIALTKQSIDYFARISKNWPKHLESLMIVPQGKTIWEWGTCAEQLCLYFRMKLPDVRLTVGLPKHTGTWEGGRINLIRRFCEPLREREFLDDVHLLGMEKEVSAVTAIAIQFPWIRSVDSAKPLVYAANRIRLSPVYASMPVYPGRPDEYFDLVFDNEQQELGHLNTHIIRQKVEIN